MIKKNLDSINRLRWIAILEGISFLVLLLIAMPLKYYHNYPMPVKYTGWIHGLLFILYIIAVLHAAYLLKWKYMRTFLFLLASFIPLATFIVDRLLKKEVPLY